MHRNDLLPLIRQAKPGQAHVLASKHGYLLIELECQTKNCGNKISHYLVQDAKHRGYRVEDDYQYFKCEHCGVRGAWVHKETQKPVEAAPAAKAEPQPAPAAPVAPEPKKSKGWFR